MQLISINRGMRGYTGERYICGWNAEAEAKKKKYYKSREISKEGDALITARRAKIAAKRTRRWMSNFKRKRGRHPHDNEVPRHIKEKMNFVVMMKDAVAALD